MKNLLNFFAAGSLGGLATGLVTWMVGDLGITRMAGVSLAPALGAQLLYPKMVWGGIWGLLFVLPFMKSRLIAKGLLLSIFPTLVQLFYIFPRHLHKGMLGIDLGALTPVFVVGFNMVWGFAAGLTLKAAK
ncbi:MAG: hypothetical protein ACM3KE_15560 [Hyphomicrobiales bacterium]